MGIGRTILLGTSGIPIALTADGLPEWKSVGATIDWTTVAAVGSDTVIPVEGVTVKNGFQFLRYGQLLCQITTQLAQTITVTGTPTGGSFTVNVVRPDTGFAGLIVVPFNASVATTQGLFDAFFGANNTVVSGAGALPGNVQTVTFGGALLGLIVPTMSLAANGLTGGTPPVTANFAASAGGNVGMYGPYDPAASDGRQTPTNGYCGLLNMTIIRQGVLGITLHDQDHVGLVVGGRVYRDRLLATSGTHSLAAGPTFTELAAAMPRLAYVHN